ncbi:MAG: alpha/beta hydrolase, partial [Candidatus Thermochlorobacter sp.]
MGLLANLERYFIYAPQKSLITTPAEHGLEFENVKFHASDNTLLHGWFVPKPNARATVLLCHGNSGN